MCFAMLITHLKSFESARDSNIIPDIYVSELYCAGRHRHIYPEKHRERKRNTYIHIHFKLCFI